MSASRKTVYRSALITRRRLLQSTLAAGAGLTILPSGVLAGPNAPSNKLNIALIGTAGRARAHFKSVKTENVVALCDVNEQNLALVPKSFPAPSTISIGESV